MERIMSEVKYNSKYNKLIIGVDGNEAVVDVYAVLEAFEVKCPALQHLIKKALMPGLRGKGTVLQDLDDIMASGLRAIDLQKSREAKET